MASLARVLSRPLPILSKVVPRVTYTTATNVYIPGKCGYAPGFEPPPSKKSKSKKNSTTTNTQKPLSKPDATTSKTVAAADTAPKISGNIGPRHEMRQRRLNYTQELLQKQKKRELVSETKRTKATLKMQALREVDAKAKMEAIEHEQSVLHELELESLLGEVETAAAETAAETLAEAEIMAGTTKVKADTKIETKTKVVMTPELRAQARATALRSREQVKSEERLSLLMRLYHSSGDFVTYENLNAKLDEFIAAPNVSHNPTLEELQADVGYKERKIVKMRMEKLQEVLEGKMMGDKLAAEGVRVWVRNQVDIARITAQETSQEMTQEMTQETTQESTQESTKETTQEPVKPVEAWRL